MGLCSNRGLTLLVCLLALALSGYAYFIELKLQEDPEYKPLCDVDENISCTKPFKSYWGKGFGLVQKVLGEKHWAVQPNPVYGFCVYTVFSLLALFRFRLFAFLQVLIASLLNLGTVYLGYVLYFVLQDFCVVCVSLYALNFLLLLLSVSKLRSCRREAALASEVRREKRLSETYTLPTSSSNRNEFKKNI